MLKLIQFFKRTFIFLLLTVVTQVGGLIYLFYRAVLVPFCSDGLTFYERRLRPILYAFVFYLASVFIFVPVLAKFFGRIPLPLFSTEKVMIQPRTYFTILANRHYVEPKLKQSVLRIAEEMNSLRFGSKIVYLDANFPFWDGFPLIPHLSHDDGEKLDIAFLYNDQETGEILNSNPSFIGYGVGELPKKGEFDQNSVCEDKGYWQYGLMEKFIPEWSKNSYKFDESMNRVLLKVILSQKEIGKIFIEPHLKTRLRLEGEDKIRFHGCRAVRHDDHIHIQL